MRLLFCGKKLSNKTDTSPNRYRIVECSPSIWRGYRLRGEDANVKTVLMRLYFQTMTFGKGKLVCAVNENDEVIHSSYVLPKCFKFPSLGKEDYTIGPCYTTPAYRGRGIYPEILSHIRSTVGHEQTVFYMSVDEKNAPSIKGIEKAGFSRCGTVKKTRLLKRYYYDIDEGK